MIVHPVAAPELLFVGVSSITAELVGTALCEQGIVSRYRVIQTSETLRAHLEHRPPEIAIVGSRPGREQPTGMSFVEQIRTFTPATRQIILGHQLTAEDETSFLYAGARGLLCEADVTVAILSKCVRSVASGQVWANSKQLNELISSLSQRRSRPVRSVLGEALLSKREDEVLQLLSEGMSNRDHLAAALKLSEHTVKNHLFHIFDKLGVSTRMEAVLYAISGNEQNNVKPTAAATEQNAMAKAGIPKPSSLGMKAPNKSEQLSHEPASAARHSSNQTRQTDRSFRLCRRCSSREPPEASAYQVNFPAVFTPNNCSACTLTIRPS